MVLSEKKAGRAIKERPGTCPSHLPRSWSTGLSPIYVAGIGLNQTCLPGTLYSKLQLVRFTQTVTAIDAVARVHHRLLSYLQWL